MIDEANTSVTRPLTDAQLKRNPMLSRLDQAVQQLRAINREMPIQQVHVLLTVAARPGITPGEVGIMVGLEQSSVSRNILALSRRSSKGAAGLGLLEARRKPDDFRATNLFLTPAGRAAVANVLDTLQGLPVRPSTPPVPPVMSPTHPLASRSPWAH